LPRSAPTMSMQPGPASRTTKPAAAKGTRSWAATAMTTSSG